LCSETAKFIVFISRDSFIFLIIHPSFYEVNGYKYDFLYSLGVLLFSIRVTILI